MIELFKEGCYYLNGETLVTDTARPVIPGTSPESYTKDLAKKNTMAYKILEAHNTTEDMNTLAIKFDAMASHDSTYVGIIQTARASGLKQFPLPYVLTNCHNSLCAVGGTINEDDHIFGLSAAKKYGGIFVPAHQAVIHSYMREMFAGCGKMILGSDSHTRYGALGTMAIGEGGPELVKQLLKRTYDLKYPGVVAIYLEGKPAPFVGPQDIALTIIKEVFKSGFVKNKVMEFIGPAIKDLSVEYRNGIDVMTTETTCLTSIWETDDQVKSYLTLHGRGDDYKALKPEGVAYYDGLVKVDLSKIKPSIALPFHPSNVYTIDELKANPYEILRTVEEDAKQIFGNNAIDFKLTDKVVDGQIMVEQGIVAGCSGGTYENIDIIANMMDGKSVGNKDFVMSVYPGSQPAYFELNKNGSINKLMEAGVQIKTAFCGPCFGAGDTPSNNALSIRHTTRNFPNREGSKPSDGQISSVALMDARSIAATGINGGVLTSAEAMDVPVSAAPYSFNHKIYDNRVYNGYSDAQLDTELKYGPNIKDWPKMIPLADNLLLKVTCNIRDEVTTTDELIPSGETSSYRSNPLRLAEFALSRKDPAYVGRSKDVHVLEKERIDVLTNDGTPSEDLKAMLGLVGADMATTSIGSIIYANRPGDGSAREQAASVQKVLGGWGNIAIEYATKRYRSNLVNWGLLPLITEEDNLKVEVGDYIYLKDVSVAIASGSETVKAKVIGRETYDIDFKIPEMSQGEREVILAGCLINYYQQQ